MIFIFRGMPWVQIIAVIDNFDLHILQFDTYFVIFGSFLRFKFSQQPRHRFAYEWLDNVKINKYVKFDPNIPCGSKVINTLTDWPRPAGLMLSKVSSTKKGGFAGQWLDSVGMHTYAKFDQNIPCGSRVMNIFTNCKRTDRLTQWVVQYNIFEPRREETCVRAYPNQPA